VTGLPPRPRPKHSASYPPRTPLGKLRWSWGSAYEIEKGRARRRDGLGSWLEAGTLDELDTMIQADYAAQPVPRDVAP